MVIIKLPISQLRNPEHFQFITDADKIFRKYNLAPQDMSGLYQELSDCRQAEEAAMAIERRNDIIKEKNIGDIYRDKLHSSMFNYIKSIIYDELDPRFDAAQRIMTVMKEVGNPTKLAENAESGMLVTLGNRLEPYRADLETTGAQVHLDKLMNANRHFMELEEECRNVAATQADTKVPSMATVRKQTDPVYRKIVNTFNVFIDLKGIDEYKDMVNDLNVLVDKYDRLLAQRGSKPKGNEEEE